MKFKAFLTKNDMKNFYSGLKEIYGPTTSSTSPLLNIHGTALITDKEDILKRWAEHFDSVLNRPSVIDNEAINRLPQIPTNEALDIMLTREELPKAISQLSSGKAPGSDSIPAEIYKNWWPSPCPSNPTAIQTHLATGNSSPGPQGCSYHSPV